MLPVIPFRLWLQRCLIAFLIVVALISQTSPVFAEPSPLTPAAAKYELEHAKSPQEAGQRMQQRSKDYKQELAKSPTPIPNAAKNAQQKTKGFFNLFSKRIRETVDGDRPMDPGEQ